MMEENEASITLQLHPKDLSQHYCTSNRRLLVFECDGVLVSQRSFLVPAAAVTNQNVISALTVLCSDPRNTVLIFSEQTPKYLEQLFGNLNVVLVAERSVFVRWAPGEPWEQQCASVGPDTSWSTAENDAAEAARAAAAVLEAGKLAAAVVAAAAAANDANATAANDANATAASGAGLALDAILAGADEAARLAMGGESEESEEREEGARVAEGTDGEDEGQSREQEEAPASQILKEVLPLLEYYTERTPGSIIEAKASAIAWNYRACDLDHGQWQAKELRVTLDGMSQRMPIHVRHAKKVVEVSDKRRDILYDT
jgi:trehalose-6-phosphatase